MFTTPRHPLLRRIFRAMVGDISESDLRGDCAVLYGPRRPVAEPRRWQNFGRVEQPVEPFDYVRDAALAQLSHRRICGPGPPSGPAVLCESGFGDKYGEVVALRTRLSRLPPCLGKMILLRKIIPGGLTGLTRLENIPKNRPLATIVIIANALVNADLSGDQAWF
jgi:hypothetical protein